MNGRNQLLLLAAGLLFACPGPLHADYTLVLKNGRRITVESYREEGGMIKFKGLGGEVGISRGQVQSILKAGEPRSRGMSLSGTEKPTAGGTTTGQEEKLEASKSPAGQAKGEGKEGGVAPGQDKVLSPEEKQAEEKAKEEKEYQSKVRQLTEQIKAARDRYSLATRGSSGPEPTLLNSEEAIKARTEDLSSRLRDARLIPEFRPGATTPGVEVQPPTSSSKEREFSELRNQINQLTKQRETLIEEMRQKGFDTGGLFLD